MGFITTHPLKVSSSYNWYIFFLTDNMHLHIEKELLSYFDTLSTEIGADALAVKGADGEPFYNRLVDSTFGKMTNMKGVKVPALMICNRSPLEIDETSGVIESSKHIKDLIYFILPYKTLRDMMQQNQLMIFMDDLATYLKENKGEEFINKTKFKKGFEWLNKFAQFEISFHIAKFNFSNVIAKLIEL